MRCSHEAGDQLGTRSLTQGEYRRRGSLQPDGCPNLGKAIRHLAQPEIGQASAGPHRTCDRSEPLPGDDEHPIITSEDDPVVTLVDSQVGLKAHPLRSGSVVLGRNPECAVEAPRGPRRIGSGCPRDLDMHVNELVVDRSVVAREEVPHLLAEIGERGHIGGVRGLVCV